MEKFIPYEKLSKKKRRELDAARRGNWGGISPVTRKPQNSKAYNRRKTQDWKRELPPKPVSFIMLLPNQIPFKHRSQSGCLKPMRTCSSVISKGRLTGIPSVARRASISSSLMVGSLVFSSMDL